MFDRKIRIHYDDGTSVVMTTQDNIPVCVSNYLDRSNGKSRARCIEFLNMNIYHIGDSHIGRLHRVYSVSDKFMQRHDLCNRFRYTTNIYDKDAWLFSPKEPRYEFKRDAAYIEGMFSAL